MAVVMADRPVGYWRLGEPSGSALDSSGYGNNGTIVGTPTRHVAGALHAVGDDGGIGLNGSTDYVSIAAAAALDLGDAFTVELWIKRSGGIGGGEQVLLGKGAGAYAITVGSSTPDAIGIAKDQIALIAESTTTITDTTTWHHVVWTKYGPTSRIYIDGADVTGSVTDATCVNGTGPLIIGADSPASEFFTGSVDEVAIYGKPLSAAQVADHFAAAAVPSYAAVVLQDSPVAYYRLGEPVSYSPLDSGPNGYHGTLLGTATRDITPGGLTADGRDDGAIELDGTSGYITAAPIVSVATTGKLSLEAWVNALTDNGLTNTLFQHGDVNPGFDLWLYWVGGNLGLTLWDAGGSNRRVAATSGVPAAAGTGWHHVVVTLDDSIDTIVFYVDGVAVTTDSTAWASSSSASLAPWNYGKRQDSVGAGSYLSGRFDELAIYTTVLSLATVQAHFTAGGGSLSGSQTVTMAAASLGLAAPTFRVDQQVQMAAASLGLAAPAFTVGWQVTMAAASLGLAAPAFRVDQQVRPNAAALTLGAPAARVDQQVRPNAAALALGAPVPRIDQQVALAASSLGLTAPAFTVAAAAFGIQPATASLNLGSFPPTILGGGRGVVQMVPQDSPGGEFPPDRWFRRQYGRPMVG